MDSESTLFERVEKPLETAEPPPPSPLAPHADKCDGHCVASAPPGGMGHHDNREPLY